ncbi:MAG: site-specific integrase [Prevotellaceae bacterium]|nr:site-specific integrase [Prevotellaceae bacterium]
MSNFKRNAEIKGIIGYTIPHLYTGLHWYVGFYAFDPVEQRMKIKRIKLNHITRVSERRSYANDLIKRLYDKLRAGWNPWIEAENSRAYTTFSDVCNAYRLLLEKFRKDKIFRKDTFDGYASYLRNLIKYNERLKSPITYIYQFNTIYITDFLDHVYIDRNNTPQTRDNYLAWLRIFARYLKAQGYMQTIVTEGIDNYSKRKKEKLRKYLPEDALIRLREHVEKTNKHYLLACYILFYCFIRPKEMSLIRIGDISFKRGIIFIPSENAKNHRDAVVTMNAKIIKLMVDLEIFKHPSDHYLFSREFMPGEQHCSEKRFRDYWIRYVRTALKFPAEYKFYSLKDSGVTMMLRMRLDTLSVRDQARHSSILMTDTYTPHDIQEANPVISKFDTGF